MAVGQSQRQTTIGDEKTRWTARNSIATAAALYTDHRPNSKEIRVVKCVIVMQHINLI